MNGCSLRGSEPLEVPHFFSQPRTAGACLLCPLDIPRGEEVKFLSFAQVLRVENVSSLWPNRAIAC